MISNKLFNENEADVIIVGSGFAGANLAYLLAQQKKKVLIIEAGAEDKSTRQDYMENFYLNTYKSPSSPYPPNDNALDPSHTNVPRATVQALDHFGDNNKSYLTYTNGSLAFTSSYERIPGGTGNHWMGTCLRMARNDFTLHSTYGYGKDWPISYQELIDDYGVAERLIGVSADVEEQKITGIEFPSNYQYPMPGIPKSHLDAIFERDVNGAPLTSENYDRAATIVTATPAGRNSIPYQGRRVCHGNTNCTPICPIQAKYDPTVTLSLALDTGYVQIKYNSVVDKVIVGADERIQSVHYITYKDANVPAKFGEAASGSLSAKQYVLAAHAIENAKILLNSRFNKGFTRTAANTSDQVGRNLMDHPTYLAWGLMPEAKPAYGYRGPISTAGIESLRDGPFRHERAAWRIEIGNEGWNWPTGDPYTTAYDFISGSNDSGLNPNFERVGYTDYQQKLNSFFTRQFRIAFLVEQDAESTNRVQLSTTEKDNLGIPRPLITYNLSDYTKNGFEKAELASQEIMRRLGAQDYTKANENAGTYFTYKDKSYDFNGAGHICGTHIMGTDKSNSVVNNYQRSWDHDNLYIIGSGSMPSIGTQNPTLTLLALTVRTSRDILNNV